MADQTGRPTPAHAASSLIGRERELAVLRAALDATLAGRGSLVLVGGEAGIGKTALAEWLLAEAVAQGASVLVGRCYDLSETPPYGPWREVFDRAPRGDALPALPTAVLLPEQSGEVLPSQDALLTRVRAYLTTLAAIRPLVLMLDDLHWADPASLDLLRFLSRGLTELPLLFLATYRSDELTRRHPLYQLLPSLVREARATRLDLRPLDQESLLALVQARYALLTDAEARLAGYLGGRSEGNPFYAGEVLRSVEEAGTLAHDGSGWHLGDLAAVGVPALLRQVIDARIDRLGDESRGLLAVAAVIGQEIPLVHWATVAGTEEDALLGLIERATEARILEPTAEGARFAHALIREALYEGTLPPRRRALHRRAAEAIMAISHPDPDAVAHHLRLADDARAAEWLVRAGARAARAFAYHSAAARYEAALGIFGEGEERIGERGWLLHRLSRMYFRADPPRNLAYLEEAARAAEAAGDRVLAAMVLTDHAITLNSREQLARGVAEYQAGLAAFEALDAPDRARLAVLNAEGAVPTLHAFRGTLAVTLAMAGRLAEAIPLAESVIADRESAPKSSALHPSSGVAQATATLASAYATFGRPAEAQQAFAAAKAAQQAIGYDANIASGAFYELLLVTLPYQADDLEERRRVAAMGEGAWARSRDVWANVSPRLAWLPLLALEGRWAEARALEASVHAAPFVRREAMRMVLGPLAREQGDVALARSIAREAFPDGPLTAPGDSSFLTALAAQRLAAALALDEGDLSTARAWLEAHDGWLAWGGAVLGQSEGALGWAAYHRAAGDLAAAREAAQRALAHASDPRQPLALLAAHRLLGEVDITTECHADAGAHLAAALALADACVAPYERALTLLVLAELRAAEGQGDAAAQTLAEARTLLEPLEARPALARADAIAARLAAPAMPAVTALPCGLTAREAEVLRLVAQGLSNAQAAERLFLSRRTVHAHLRTIYDKLGVSSRSAATRFAIEHNLA